MRSRDPEAAAPAVRSPDGPARPRRAGRAADRARRRRGRLPAPRGDQGRPGRGARDLRSSSSSRPSRSAPATPSRSRSPASPADADLDDGDLVVLPGRHAAAAAGDARRPRRAHREPTPPRRCSPRGSTDPTGYGRIVRRKRRRGRRGSSRTSTQRRGAAIDEVDTSIYCFRHGVLAPALRRLSPDNAQGEYYLTDTIERARRRRLPGRVARRRRSRSRRPG